MEIVTIGGLGLLVVIAVVVGVLDRRDQDGAWRHIARERRELTDLRAALRRDDEKLNRRRAELDRRERILDLRDELDRGDDHR